MTGPDLETKQPRAGDSEADRVGRVARLWRVVRPRRRWCWGTRLVVTASLGWLIFLLLHRLLSGRTWVWSPFDLAPPLLFLAVPLGLLVVAPLARPVRWRIMALVLVTGLLGAGYSGLNPATLWYTPPPAPPDAITMVSWNTEFWDYGADPADFYGYLRELEADVYLLQEYLHFDSEEFSQIDRTPQLRREFPGHDVVAVGEQIVISRFPIVYHRGLDLRRWFPDEMKEVPPSSQDFPEGYTVETLRTDLMVDGTVVSFYNAHPHQPSTELLLYRSDAREISRYHQHRREASFHALRTDLAANPNPVVIGTDLNSSPAMGMRREVPDHLVDHTRALSSVYPATWHAGIINLWRLDWLFTTSDVSVHSYEFVAPDGLSDHRAQRAVLSLDS